MGARVQVRGVHARLVDMGSDHIVHMRRHTDHGAPYVEPWRDRSCSGSSQGRVQDDLREEEAIQYQPRV